MKKLILLLLLAISCYAETVNTDILPAQTGLNLGRQNQRWNGFFQNMDITGALTVNGAAGHFTIYPIFGTGHYAVSTDLTSVSPGCAFWIAGNQLGIGPTPCLTAVPTPNVGDCAIWATTSTLSSTPCSGGGGGGDLKSIPTLTQVVSQPKGTTFAPNNLHQVRYATNFQWTQSPASPTSIAIGSNVVTINAVLGISAYSVSKVKHYLWLAATGTPERVLITATTCTGINTAGSTCTVTFTAAGTHTAGYTLGTATGGWQEAWVDAFPTNIAANPIIASKLAGSPNNDNSKIYVFNAPLDIDMQRGTQAPISIDFQGATVSCNTGGLDCLDIDTGTAGTVLFQPEGLTISNALFIPAIGMGRTANGTTVVIRDKGQKTHLSGISFGFLNTSDVFDDLILVDGDQAFSADHLIMNPGNGPPMVCDATYCGSGIKGTALAAGALIYLTQSDLSMQCKGNGVDSLSGNTVHISDTVIQAYNQFAARAVGSFSVNPAMEWTNVYNEVGSCVNPLGTGTAGAIIQGGWFSKQGGVGPVGKPQSFTASSAGATQFNYFVEPKSSTLGTGNAIPAGSCLSSGAGTCAVKFNQIGSSGTMTYDIIRTTGLLSGTNPAPYTAICTGGSVSACGSVSVGLTTAACSGGVCSLSDDVTANTTSYTVIQLPTFFPKVSLWPGAVVLGPNGDTNNVNNGSTAIFVADRFLQSTATGGFVTTAGRRNVSAVISSCGSTFGNWESGYVQCVASDATAGTAISEMLQLGSAPSSSIKGRTIYELDPGATSPARDIITLSDSNPSATAATAGGIAASDAGDVAIGYDNASTTVGNFNLGYRAPIGHRWYVNSIFDNSSWKMQLNASGLTLGLPYISTVTTGTAPFTIASTTKVVNLNVDQTDGVSLQKFTATLSPASVGANTCAEQLFTVTGVAIGDFLFVNKPTAQAGLGIAGVRTSTTNQVGINYCNTTASPIVPTASEVYSVGVLR